jgi:DNA polymerase-3 subunit delta
VRASVRRIAEAPDKPVYLITGSDRPKVEVAIARLRSHFEDEAVEHVSALDVPGDEAAGLCNAGSLFGDARLILVTEVDGVKAERGRRGGWKAADVDAVAAYIASPAPATVLALVAEELKSSSALWKACAKAGQVLAFDVAKKELHGWVAEQFRQRGVRAEPDASAALVQLVGDDLQALKTEVDKIATWAGDEPVGEREVTTLVASNIDVPGYELTEAWATRDVERALGLSETTFHNEPRSRRDVAARLVGQLAAHLGRLRSLKRLAAEGVSSKEAAARLKLNPYYASKLYRQAEGFSDEELDDALLRLAELDGALKGQSKLNPDLEMQRTLVALSRRPGAARS